MNKYKLSYLVSTYDSGHFLDTHVAYLLEKQTDPDFEIIIVNPNSPGTDDIIAKKWEAEDERVKYIYWPQREPYGVSWMRAWQNAEGDFVVNSNTDDHHAPTFTAAFHAAMSDADPKVGFCYSGLQMINEFGQIIGGGLKPQFDFDTMS
jgi:hypothetical protein